MFNKIPALALAAFVFVLFCFACSKPTPFGGDLLDDQLADYDFTDTLSMIMSVEPEDSAIFTNDRNTADYFLCGELSDPKFGKSSAAIYTLMQTTSNAVNFQDARYRYDSIFMYLKLNVNGIYGDTTQAQTLRIMRLNTNIDSGDSVIYRSNQSIPAGDVLGEITFLPNPSRKDSLISTTARGSFVKIKLSDTFGQELFGYDSLTYTADSSFERKFKGLKIVASSNANPGALLAFSLNDANFSLMRLFYTKDDTLKQEFTYQFTNAKKFVGFSHDYAGSEVQPFIGHKVTDRVYMQGMGGLRFKVEFPTAANLDNIAVNKAELILTVADQLMGGDNLLLFPSRQMIATQYVNDTTFAFVPDVINSIGSSGNAGYGRFGGFPVKKVVNGTAVTQYQITLTQHFQDLIDNTSSDVNKRTVWFTITPQSRNASRAIFYGPASSVFPAKLEMKYTKVR